MTTLIPLLLSTALLAASPTDDTSDTAARAQAFSMAAGVLGAATGCDQIARDQLSQTAKMVSELAAAQASDLDELTSIKRLLMVSAAAGRQAIQDGKTDCKTVEASFHQLEELVLQTPIAWRK